MLLDLPIRSLWHEVEFTSLADQLLDSRWVAFWFRHLLPHDKPAVQPRISVSSRRLYTSSPDPPYARARIAVTALGQLRLRSIVADGCKREEFELPERRFSVVFERSMLSDTLSSEILEDARLPEWFQGVTLGGPVLGFRLRSGGVLWIPSMEPFSRLYGRSQEIKRVLLTYPWDAVQTRLFAPVDSDPDVPFSGWRIQYGSASSRLVNAHAVFLAHLRHCLWTNRCGRWPYHSMNDPRSSFHGQGPVSGYVPFPPWFLGPIDLIVGAFLLRAGSFLSLRIEGASEPPGPPIQHVRRVPDSPGSRPDDTDADATPTYVRRRVARDPVPLTSEESPDLWSPEAELLDQPFRVLGPRRKVTRVSSLSTGDRSRSLLGPSDAEAFAPGESSGSGKGIGLVRPHAPEQVESRGVLLDVWDALLHLQAWHPDWLVAVESLDPSGGFVVSSRPHLVSLLPAGSSLQRSVTRWAWMDPDSTSGQGRPRGFLVVCTRVRTDPRWSVARTLYLVEIERRGYLTQKGEEQEEKFSGLVFELDGDDEPAVRLPGWLPQLRSLILRHRGVFRQSLCAALRHAFPGRPIPFNTHRLSETKLQARLPCATRCGSGMSSCRSSQDGGVRLHRGVQSGSSRCGPNKCATAAGRRMNPTPGNGSCPQVVFQIES